MIIKIQLTPEACILWSNAWKEHELLLKPGGQLEDMKDWGGKLMGNVLRISGLIHAVNYPTDYLKRPIDGEVMSRAIEVGKYLIPHARAGYSLASQRNDIQLASRIYRWIIERQLRTFTKNECHKRFKNTVQTAAELTKILQVLIDRSYIREISASKGGSGRPSTIYEVNPKVF